MSSALSDRARLGVLGGMGPLATADFLKKLVAVTPAQRDQDHVPAIVYSVPQIPDRVGPIMRQEGESPLPAMIEGVRTLEAAGASCIAIPCITAHHWYDPLCQVASVPVLHIADATRTLLTERCPNSDVGLLATTATLRSGFFQRRLEAAGFGLVLPTDKMMQQQVLPAIACVKRHDMAGALQLACEAVEGLLARDVKAVVLACSELPVAIEGAEPAVVACCVDTLAALAQACVAWHRLQKGEHPRD